MHVNQPNQAWLTPGGPFLGGPQQVSQVQQAPQQGAWAQDPNQGRPVFGMPVGTAYVRQPLPQAVPQPVPTVPRPMGLPVAPVTANPAQLRQALQSQNSETRFEQYKPVEFRDGDGTEGHGFRQLAVDPRLSQVEGRPVVPAQTSGPGNAPLSAVKAKLKDQLKGAPLDSSSPLRAAEITGGNLNYAFVVQDDKAAVFVKQAPDYIKVIGPEAQLTRERMRLEVQVYGEWMQAGDEMSRFLPKIWMFDEEAMAFIMEYLASYQLLQGCLFEGNAQVSLAKSLGQCMATMHSRTHCSKLDAAEIARLTKTYENRTLRDIQLEYVFSKCYREDSRASALRADEAFMMELEKIKAVYNGVNTKNLALCHGDLHAGSVMVDGAKSEVKIIDPEFAIFGPPGLDVGSLMSTYVMAYCFHRSQGHTASADAMHSAARGIWEAYVDAMKAASIASEILQQIEVETLGFLGCEVARTALGLSFERSLRIEDAALKARAEEKALQLAVTCIRQRSSGMTALTPWISLYVSVDWGSLVLRICRVPKRDEAELQRARGPGSQSTTTFEKPQVGSIPLAAQRPKGLPPFYWVPAVDMVNEFEVSGACGELVMKTGHSKELGSAFPIAGSLRLDKGGLYLWTLQIVRQCEERPQ
eukprot:symbB.v1.2.024996.t1/scaffold2402.1/size80084/3